MFKKSWLPKIIGMQNLDDKLSDSVARSAGRRSRNWRRDMAILAMPEHGRDARRTGSPDQPLSPAQFSRGKREFKVLP
jgi:hypothetical protein